MDPLTLRTPVRELLLLWSVALVGLTAFLFKAVHIDDAVFLWVAEQIQHHPFDYFGFSINWHGTRAPVYMVNKNPPLISYWFALAGWGGAKAAWALHTAALPLSLLAVTSVYALARRLCAAPLAAASLALATPAFAVSATTLMTDVPMLAFWCLAVWLWLVGMEAGRAWLLAASAFSVGLCALSKYFGIALIPLLGAYTIARERRLDPRLLWLLLPVAMLAAFETYSRSLYHMGVVANALSYAGSSRARIGVPPLESSITALSFTGGCLLATSLLGPLFTRRALPWVAGALVLTVPPLVLLLGKVGVSPLRAGADVHWRLLVPLLFFALAGANVLALTLAELWRDFRNPETVLLALWVAGTFVFAGYLNWGLSARVILPMAPAVAILAVRRIQALRPEWLPTLGTRMALPVIAGLALSLAVARGDEEFAETGHQAALTLAQAHLDVPGELYFQGHWGMQFYLQPLGGKPYDRFRDPLRPGDWLVEPQNATNLLRLPSHWFEIIDVLRFPSSRWVTTTALERGAGFYSSGWGPLPFALGSAPDEIYEIKRVLLPIAPAPPPRS